MPLITFFSSSHKLEYLSLQCQKVPSLPTNPIMKIGGSDKSFPSFHTLLAISEITTRIGDKNPDFLPSFLVISLGTGMTRVNNKYDSEMASRWGLLDWLLHGKSSPLIEAFRQAPAEMVDFHTSVLFQALPSKGYYLRIEVRKHSVSSIKTSVF
jgi:hypothetical protein